MRYRLPKTTSKKLENIEWFGIARVSNLSVNTEIQSPALTFSHFLYLILDLSFHWTHNVSINEFAENSFGEN